MKSRTGRGVFKCSVAYLLGSLATFVPFIAAILGQQDGKHMVATITVYFHPARSLGSMFEAILLALIAFFYATFIGFTSMGVSILFGRTLDLIALGHAIVLVFFCGGGLGFVGWIKQRLGNPLVNIACSLTSLAIITVLTKEGAVQAASFSDDKIVQVLKMIIMGVIATTAVSLLISPISARTDLRDNMISVTDSFAEILIMITRGFLSGLEDETKTKQYQKWTDQYKKALASLDKSLREAKFEHYVFGTEREYNLEARLVECMQRLAQNIGGLRGAASTQFLLLAQSSTGIAGQHFSLSSTPISDIDQVMTPPSDQHGIFIATGSEGEALGRETYTPHFQGYSEDVTEDQSISSPADIFKEFIFHLGPSMVSISP